MLRKRSTAMPAVPSPASTATVSSQPLVYPSGDHKTSTTTPTSSAASVVGAVSEIEGVGGRAKAEGGGQACLSEIYAIAKAVGIVDWAADRLTQPHQPQLSTSPPQQPPLQLVGGDWGSCSGRWAGC